MSDPEKGREWFKTQKATLQCHCVSNGLPGVLIPVYFDDAGESEDGRVFVDRCDSCALFRSAYDAALFLGAVLGLSVVKLYDNEVDDYFRCYFEMSLADAMKIRLHAAPLSEKTCLQCIAEER